MYQQSFPVPKFGLKPTCSLETHGNRSEVVSRKEMKVPVGLEMCTPAAARISFTSPCIVRRLAAGLGQSCPFIEAYFQSPRLTSAEQ